MVLKFFRGLLNIALKMFNEKAFHNRWKCQLLAGALRTPKKTDGVWELHLDCGGANHLGNCPMPLLHQALLTLWTCLGWLLCSAGQSKVKCPKFLLHRNLCQRFWAWQLKVGAALCGSWRCKAALYDSPRLTSSAPNEAMRPWVSRAAILVVGKTDISTDIQAMIWIIAPAMLYPSQISTDIDRTNCGFNNNDPQCQQEVVIEKIMSPVTMYYQWGWIVSSQTGDR